MTIFDITIDMAATCAECGKPGRCPNNLCLSCVTKALRGLPRKSATGKAVAKHLKEYHAPKQESK